jgi:hypothetical protein
MDAGGAVLFERVWRWPAGDTPGEGISALVQTLYQFAREVDAGGEFRVGRSSEDLQAHGSRANARPPQT